MKEDGLFVITTIINMIKFPGSEGHKLAFGEAKNYKRIEKEGSVKFNEITIFEYMRKEWFLIMEDSGR